ncbi:MAG: hypothetical protein HY093_02190 [Candidatus Liptonbacteria bacterium]|nr:hypothetical protein [Candidatus Liptonbacteria bacterium]
MSNFAKKIKLPHRSCSTGQALPEAIVALGLITVGLIAVLAFLNHSSSSVSRAIDRNIASNLAEEGLSIVKSAVAYEKAKSNFNQSFSSNRFAVDYHNGLGEAPKDWSKVSANQFGTPLHFDDSNNLYGYSGNFETKFYRVIDIDANANFIKANSIVKWQPQGGGSPETVNLETYFYNY